MNCSSGRSLKGAGLIISAITPIQLALVDRPAYIGVA